MSIRYSRDILFQCSGGAYPTDILMELERCFDSVPRQVSVLNVTAAKIAEHSSCPEYTDKVGQWWPACSEFRIAVEFGEQKISHAESFRLAKEIYFLCDKSRSERANNATPVL